jgi:hypothetical protein
MCNTCFSAAKMVMSKSLNTCTRVCFYCSNLACLSFAFLFSVLIPCNYCSDFISHKINIASRSPNWHWGPSKFLLNDYPGLFLRGEESGTCRSPFTPFSTQIKNQWSCNPTPPFFFRMCTGTNLPLRENLLYFLKNVFDSSPDISACANCVSPCSNADVCIYCHVNTESEAFITPASTR